jgi:hypothetical protein
MRSATRCDAHHHLSILQNATLAAKLVKKPVQTVLDIDPIDAATG